MIRKIFLCCALLCAFSVEVYAAEVVAVQEKSGAPVEAEAVINAPENGLALVSNNKVRVELSPYAVGSFTAAGTFRLLRGSAILESKEQRTVSTNSTELDFIGTLLLSYDYREKSTSAFVTDGEARMKNPHRAEVSLRLDRWKGASMVVGDVYPAIVRDLSAASLGEWMKGYAWSRERRSAVLKDFPASEKITEEKSPEKLAEENVTLQDYFATIDSNEDRPDYYEKKFADPDKVVAEANAKKADTKYIAPEEAAMISLPSTKVDVDLGVPMEILSAKARQDEILRKPSEGGGRAPASLERPQPGRKSVAAKQHAAPAAEAPRKNASDGEDQAVESALQRLRGLRADADSERKTRAPASFSGYERAPAAIQSPVPDPVYDFSENF